MKKLMFAAAAAAACVAFAGDAPVVQSANIVGYGTVADGGKKAASVGSIFFPISMEGEFDLLDMTVQGATADDFMFPDAEWMRQLDPGSTANVHCYSYVSRTYIEQNIDDEHPEDYDWAIGWWYNENDPSIAGSWSIEEEICNDLDTHKVKTPTKLTMGMAFLGSFLGNGLRFVSSGAVKQDTADFCDNGKKAPFFCNFLPTAIDLSDIEVEGDTEDEFMFPDAEWLRQLDPGSTANVHCYSYVSRTYIEQNIDDEHPEDYDWAIGWWYNENDPSIAGSWSIEDDIGNDSDEHMVKTAIAIAPGQAFLGSLLGNKLHFKFPSALDVKPTK